MVRNLILFSLSLLVACEQAPVAPEATPVSPAVSGGGAVGDYMSQQGKKSPVASTGTDGVVVETMNSGGYTYVNVDHCGEKIWLAGPETAVSVGDTVWAPAGAEMPGFESKTLNRVFEQIRFVSSIERRSLPVECGTGHTGSATTELKPLAPVKGVLSLADLHQRAAELQGQVVTIQGHVTKFNANIMKTNWLHLQDGTGQANDKTNDLTVTTSESFSVGDVVRLRGTLAVDRDFGAGYRYAVIVEEAQTVSDQRAE